MLGLSLVAASGGHSSSRCAGLSPSRPLLLQSTGSRRAGSVIVTHGPSRSAACGILPDQGSNPCPLHRQVDPQPLRHQGSPQHLLFKNILCVFVFFTLLLIKVLISFRSSILDTVVICFTTLYPSYMFGQKKFTLILYKYCLACMESILMLD